MSDLDSTDLAVPSTRFTEELTKDLGELLGDEFERSKSGEREREGLPPSYRMRADAHYVEQLSARSADAPIRLIGVDEIESSAIRSIDELSGLIRSIAAHGILQPLLVRRRGARYEVIAGRKRLAAARAARVSRVPCLVHQVDDEEAEQLARAENLRVGHANTAPGAAGQQSAAKLLAHVSETIATIQSAGALLAGRGTPIARRVALDLVRAEAWRADWQLRACMILEDGHTWRLRPLSIGSIISQVCDGFRPESRLKRIDLSVNIPDWNLSANVDEDGISCAVAGALIATAGLIEETEPGAIAITVVPSGSAIAIDVSQDKLGISIETEGRFFDLTWSDRPGGWAAALGAASAVTVAERHGGSATLVARERRGTTIRLLLAR